MRPLRKFDPEDKLSDAEGRFEKLEVAVSSLLKAFSALRMLAYAVCAFMLLLTIATAILVAAVLATSQQSIEAHYQVIEYGGLYHEPWCERLIDAKDSKAVASRDVARHRGLHPCPDCIR